MTDFDYKEKRFEQDIEEYLTTKVEYEKGNPNINPTTMTQYNANILHCTQRVWSCYEKLCKC